MQKSYLVFDVLDGVLQLPAPGSVACASIPRTVALAARRSASAVSTAALFTADRVLIWLLVQLGEKIALVHTVVVVHQHPGDLAADAGSDERHMAVDVGVVRRDGVEGCKDPGDAEYADGRQN